MVCHRFWSRNLKQTMKLGSRVVDPQRCDVVMIIYFFMHIP